MALTQTDRDTRSIKMFGCTEEALESGIAEYVAFTRDPANLAKLMLAASMLSDSQEQIARGDAEGARQTINQAKKVIFDVRDALRAEGR